MNDILRLYLDKFYIAYLDDIIVYSRNRIEYIEYIKRVLKALKKYNLRLKLSKYFFFKIEVDFLGYIVILSKIVISKGKVVALLN